MQKQVGRRVKANRGRPLFISPVPLACHCRSSYIETHKKAYQISSKPVDRHSEHFFGKGPPVLIRLLILFTVVPVIEIYLIIKTGQVIGPLPTVILLLAISSAGAWLVRAQGFQTLRSIRNELAQGRLPAAQLLDGAMVLVGGVLLLTPGFLTDLLGLLFLMPITLPFIKRLVGSWLQRRLEHGTYVIRSF